MFNLRKIKKNKKRGFTLIELIIVIAILAILAAILVPSMLNVVGNARTQVDTANASAVYSAAQAAYVSIVSANGAITGTSHVSTATGDNLIDKVKTSLGSAFTTSVYTITTDANGVVSVVYTGQSGSITYPVAAATPAPTT